MPKNEDRAVPAVAVAVEPEHVGPTSPLSKIAVGTNAADDTAMEPTQSGVAFEKTYAPSTADDVGFEDTDEQPGDFDALQSVASDNYRLGAEIARGGMGRIVEARDRRLGRTIAIKELLSPSPMLEKRFEREMRITAGLQHPAIISVLEAGRWPNGRAFYTMNLVEGQPLDKVIDRAPSLAKRLALLPHMIDIAEAMAYAHSERVIHRDLKPGNILIGEFGQTIVIDWGLAKHVGSSEDDELTVADANEYVGQNEPLTVLGRAMGTPAYMPPAQARGETLDAQADVYALGAILYHALSGQMPYTGAKSSAEILRKVLKGPPEKLRSLAPDIPSELETIVEKAMSRDIEHRYATAKGFADDLRRFETGKLVSAHTYSARELFGRWLRRNLAAAVVGFVLLSCLGGFGVWSVQNISHERDRAEASVRVTEENMDFMLGDLREKLEAIGKLELLGLVADRVASYYAAQPIDWNRPKQVLNRSRALQHVAAVLKGLGDSEGARNQYQQVLELLQRLADNEPQNLEVQRSLASAQGKFGHLLQDLGDLEEALSLFERALRIAKAIVEEEPDESRWQNSLVVAHENLGYALKLGGQLDGALQHYAQALPLAASIAKDDPEDMIRQAGLLTSHIGLGDLRWAGQDAQGALLEYEAAMGIGERLVAHDAENAEWREHLATSTSRVGGAQMALQRFDEALISYQSTVEARRRLGELDPDNESWRAAYAFSLKQMGDVLRATGKLAEGIASYRKFIAAMLEIVAKDSANVRMQSLLASGYEGLGEALAEEKKLEPALEALLAGIGITRAIVAKEPTNSDWRLGLLNTYLTTAMMLDGYEDVRALEFASQCAELYPGLHDSLAASYLAASCLTLLGNADGAFSALERAIELGWTDVDGLQGEASLATLRSDPRWQRLIDTIAAP